MATAELSRLERSFVATSEFSQLLADLSERERILGARASASRAEPVIRTVSLRSRGKLVSFKYVDNGEPRPTWFAPVLQGFASLVTLSDNWDGERARKIDSATINRALIALEELLPRDAPAPSIVPVPNAGLQIEWHRKGKDLEIEFNPAGSVTYYYFDSDSEEEREGRVGPQFATVREYLKRIW